MQILIHHSRIDCIKLSSHRDCLIKSVVKLICRFHLNRSFYFSPLHNINFSVAFLSAIFNSLFVIENCLQLAAASGEKNAARISNDVRKSFSPFFLSFMQHLLFITIVSCWLYSKLMLKFCCLPSARVSQ